MGHEGHNVITSTLETIMKAKQEVAQQELQHGTHNLQDGMIMSFHGGYSETILFDFWNTTTLPSMHCLFFY